MPIDPWPVPITHNGAGMNQAEWHAVYEDWAEKMMMGGWKIDDIVAMAKKAGETFPKDLISSISAKNTLFPGADMLYTYDLKAGQKQRPVDVHDPSKGMSEWQPMDPSEIAAAKNYYAWKEDPKNAAYIADFGDNGYNAYLAASRGMKSSSGLSPGFLPAGATSSSAGVGGKNGGVSALSGSGSGTPQGNGTAGVLGQAQVDSLIGKLLNSMDVSEAGSKFDLGKKVNQYDNGLQYTNYLSSLYGDVLGTKFTPFTQIGVNDWTNGDPNAIGNNSGRRVDPNALPDPKPDVGTGHGGKGDPSADPGPITGGPGGGEIVPYYPPIPVPGPGFDVNGNPTGGTEPGHSRSGRGQGPGGGDEGVPADPDMTTPADWERAHGGAHNASLSGIQHFATGGFVPATPGGSLIRAGEGGEGEFVIPASKMPAMSSMLSGGGPGGGNGSGGMGPVWAGGIHTAGSGMLGGGAGRRGGGPQPIGEGDGGGGIGMHPGAEGQGGPPPAPTPTTGPPPGVNALAWYYAHGGHNPGPPVHPPGWTPPPPPPLPVGGGTGGTNTSGSGGGLPPIPGAPPPRTTGPGFGAPGYQYIGGNLPQSYLNSFGQLGLPAQQIGANLDSNKQALLRSMPEGGERNLAMGEATNTAYGNMANLRQGLVQSSLGGVQNLSNQTMFGGTPTQNSGAANSLTSLLNGQNQYSLGLQQLQAGKDQSNSSMWGTIIAGLAGALLSDARTKEDVKPFTRGLSDLVKLNPKTYTYNGLGGSTKGEPGISVMAQELEHAIPEAVVDPGVKHIIPMGLLMTAINSIKELDAKVTKLSKKERK